MMAGNYQQLGIDLLLLEGRADGPIHVQIPDTKYDLYILPAASLKDYRDHNKMNLAGVRGLWKKEMPWSIRTCKDFDPLIRWLMANR